MNSCPIWGALGSEWVSIKVMNVNSQLISRIDFRRFQFLFKSILLSVSLNFLSPFQINLSSIKFFAMCTDSFTAKINARIREIDMKWPVFFR